MKLCSEKTVANKSNKMKQKLEIIMLDKQFWKIASLKPNCSEKSIKCSK